MRRTLALGAAALLSLAATAVTTSSAEAQGFGWGRGFRGGGFYGGGFRPRPAFGGYGWRGGVPLARRWGGYPGYGYYRRGWGYGGAIAAGLAGGAIGSSYAYPAYYSYAYPAYYGSGCCWGPGVIIPQSYCGY